MEIPPSGSRAGGAKNRGEFVRRYDFQLLVGAVLRLLIEAPSPELRGVAEASALHVLIGDFHDQFRTQRLPGKILAAAPAALRAGHAAARIGPGPRSPRMIFERVLPIRFQKLHQLQAHLIAEAGAHADVLQRAGIVVQTEQQRADAARLAFFVPAETGGDAIAIALVLDLQHDALVRLVAEVERLGDDAIESG